MKILTKNYVHIGNLRIHDVNKKKFCFLGIFVGDKKQKNKGIAQEVIHYICKFLFAKYKISKVYLGVDQTKVL